MTNTNTEINFQDLINLIEEVTHGDYRIYDGYSGRGMFGRLSPLAISTDVHPSSEAGETLIDVMGMACDNLGLSYIYYYTRDLPNAEEIQQEIDREDREEEDDEWG